MANEFDISKRVNSIYSKNLLYKSSQLAKKSEECMQLNITTLLELNSKKSNNTTNDKNTNIQNSKMVEEILPKKSTEGNKQVKNGVGEIKQSDMKQSIIDIVDLSDNSNDASDNFTRILAKAPKNNSLPRRSMRITGTCKQSEVIMIGSPKTPSPIKRRQRETTKCATKRTNNCENRKRMSKKTVEPEIIMIGSPETPAHAQGEQTALFASCTTTTKGSSNNEREYEDIFNDENEEFSVKFIYNGKLEISKLRKYQKFSHIFDILAKRENKESNKFIFDLNDKFISPEDTPFSINYKTYDLISVNTLDDKISSVVSTSLLTQTHKSKQKDPDVISLKIQLIGRKAPILIDMNKKEKFKILYIKCSEELKHPMDKLTLKFDGEYLEYSNTPIDVDMESGDIVDLSVQM